MRSKRVRRGIGANMTQEDRKAAEAYRMNRRSSRYYSDLDAINTVQKTAEPTKTTTGGSEK